MRIMKKLLVLIMATLMLVGLTAFSAFAADESVDYTDAAQSLVSINVMKGDTSGNLMLDSGVTRYQAALFFVQALTGETEVSKWNAEPKSEVFSDVPEYGTAIDYAYGIGLILGRGNGEYGYNDPITYQDMLVLAVRALGYETKGMNYPYGYILEADKLGITENLEKGIAKTKALTRGETAQIIWDMLNTQVAAVDPVTDKILYPDEYGVSGSILGVSVERETLLEKAGFSNTVIESIIVEYTPAKTSKDVATVTLENGMEIAASDLGITARTNASDFLGLPVELYVDSASEDDFEKEYDIVSEDSEASIIFVNFIPLTTVKNVGDQGNIKYTVGTNDVPKLTLADKTFGGDKYAYKVCVLDAEDGWVELDAEDGLAALENFEYDSKKGYIGKNSYGEITYGVNSRKIDNTVVDELYILYKPYEFGQYFTRTMRYQPLVSNESFITIGKYSPDAVKIAANGTVSGNENVDDDYTFFIETVLGSDLVFDSSITSISKRDGEASREAKISGGSVRSGDFIFYYYNELDNVLVIGQNCGALKSGNLTSQNASAETVKIDGTAYTYGFAGAFENEFDTFAELDINANFITKVEAGEKNVEYVAIDGQVIYIQRPLNPSGNRVKHNYIVATVDPEIMADLLNMDVDDYEEELTDDGVYVAASGNMQIAVLNTTNGKWGLAEVAQYEYGSYRSTTELYHNNYNHEDAEWANVVNMAEAIENYDIFGASFKGYDKYAIARDALLHGGMFAVRANKSGVYDLCVMFHPDDYGMINNGKVTDGLYFSDTAAKTNDLKAVRNESTEPARVTLNANTVVVVVDKAGNVGVRVGIQGKDNSIVFNGVTDSAPAYLYSASSKLIVLQLPLGKNLEDRILDNDGNQFDVKTWAGEATAGADETYYVGLNGADVEYERLDDGTYELTVSGLFNLRTMRTVAAIKLNVEDLDDTDIEDEDLVGAVLYMDKKGNLNVSDVSVQNALTNSVNMRYDYSSTDSDRYYTIDGDVEFVDDSSISVTIGDNVLDKKNAVSKINVTVATLDASDIDWEKYDINDAAYPVEYDEDNEWGVGSVQYSKSKNDKYFAYDISELNKTSNITEPVAGVLDQYIIDTVDETVIFAENEGEYFDDAAEASVKLFACGQFNEDDGIVNIIVIKALVNAD